MKKKILIIDDSRPILTLLHVILHKRFQVYALPNAFEALEWLGDGNRPDLIISDLQMPYIDGTELISYLSKSTCYDEIPILILSGMANKEVVNQIDNRRIAGFISKPFDPVELISMVDKALKEVEQSSGDSFLFI